MKRKIKKGIKILKCKKGAETPFFKYVYTYFYAYVLVNR